MESYVIEKPTKAKRIFYLNRRIKLLSRHNWNLLLMVEKEIIFEMKKSFQYSTETASKTFCIGSFQISFLLM